MNSELFSPDSPALISAFPFITIKNKLGEGGQKYVYEAYTETEGMVAFKVIKVEQQYERTMREIDAASKFSPPRFPKIHSYGRSKVANEDVVYIVEEFIEGVSLRERLRLGAMQESEAVKIGYELLNALCEVAEQHLVHRDIKPENIMLGENDRAVLLDFGIARHLNLTSLTHDAAMFGPLTPGYAAPEQIRNEKRSISPRTDLFAWGIVMYEMLSGENPFTKGCSSPGEALMRTLQFDVPKLSNCSSNLSEIIDWCMKKPAHRRPANPIIVLNALKEVIS
jgi:eukaryotic-like serine/threonine-protein kinase